jgi:rare lipoprotein A
MRAWTLISAIAVLCLLAFSAVASVRHLASRHASAHCDRRAQPNSKLLHCRRKIHHRAYAGPRSFTGVASYYWEGEEVASGARYNPDGLTAAHRTLPLGTRLRVTDLESKRNVVVTVNDRGPFIPGRILDLSRGAAQVLGMLERGLTRIKAKIL